VGSGLAGKEQDRLLDALRGRNVDTSPFVDKVPPIDAQGTRWVRPEVVVEVQSLGLSAQGRLRQPAYRGLRPDLSPDDLRDDLSEG
jgi:bifunctional non-homologous end joining protein LigD